MTLAAPPTNPVSQAEPESATPADEVLFRQIHPTWYQKEEPTSQAFAPTPKDDNKLSFDRSSIVTAEASFRLHTMEKKLPSAAVFGLDHAELAEQSLTCVPDPIEASEGEIENPAHAYADYSSHSGNAQKNIAKRLKRKAIERGCLFRPSVGADR